MVAITAIYPCPEHKEPSGTQTYCCGDECCKNDAPTFTVPVGTVLSRSSQIPMSASGSKLLSISGSAQSTSRASSSTPPNPAPPSTSQSHGPTSHAAAIGLGVGIPLGLILIASVLPVYFELRRHNSLLAAQASAELEPTGHVKPVQLTDTGVVQRGFTPADEIAEHAAESIHESPQST